MDKAIYNIGFDAGISFANDGNPVRIQLMLGDAHSADPNRRAAGAVACVGVFASFAATLDAAKNYGVRFSNPIPTPAEFNYELALGNDAYSLVAQRLYDAVVALRHGAPGMKVSRQKQTPTPTVQTIERDPVSQEITRITTVEAA